MKTKVTVVLTTRGNSGRPYVYVEVMDLSIASDNSPNKRWQVDVPADDPVSEKEYKLMIKQDDTVTDIEKITFTIEDVEYTAEIGMTWEEFINSEYNIENKFYLSGFSVEFVGDNSVRTIIKEVLPSTEIIKGTNYLDACAKISNVVFDKTTVVQRERSRDKNNSLRPK